jgi:DNA-binding CsgD family transcriptional regulator
MNPRPEHSSLHQAPRRSGAHPSGTVPRRPRLSIARPAEAIDGQISGEMLPRTGSSLKRWAAVLRAAVRPEDVERLRADAELAIEQLGAGNYFRSAALHVLEIAHQLAGDEGSQNGTAAHVNGCSDGEDLETHRFHMRLAASLTACELRLLPFLATHLSLGAIGERLYITRNTVKSEAISTYRKLGVSSRSEAVERAAQLGLIDATAATAAGDPGLRPSDTQEQLIQFTPVAVVALIAGVLAPRTRAPFPEPWPPS